MEKQNKEGILEEDNLGKRNEGCLTKLINEVDPGTEELFETFMKEKQQKGRAPRKSCKPIVAEDNAKSGAQPEFFESSVPTVEWVNSALQDAFKSRHKQLDRKPIPKPPAIGPLANLIEKLDSEGKFNLEQHPNGLSEEPPKYWMCFPHSSEGLNALEVKTSKKAGVSQLERLWKEFYGPCGPAPSWEQFDLAVQDDWKLRNGLIKVSSVPDDLRLHLCKLAKEIDKENAKVKKSNVEPNSEASKPCVPQEEIIFIGTHSKRGGQRLRRRQPRRRLLSDLLKADANEKKFDLDCYLGLTPVDKLEKFVWL